MMGNEYSIEICTSLAFCLVPIWIIGRCFRFHCYFYKNGVFDLVFESLTIDSELSFLLLYALQ